MQEKCLKLKPKVCVESSDSIQAVDITAAIKNAAQSANLKLAPITNKPTPPSQQVDPASLFRSSKSPQKNKMIMNALFDDGFDFEPSPINSQKEEDDITAATNPKKRKFGAISNEAGTNYDEFQADKPEKLNGFQPPKRLLTE